MYEISYAHYKLIKTKNWFYTNNMHISDYINLALEKPKAKTITDEAIQFFVDEINAERESYGWKYKQGEKFVKIYPVKFMSVKMKLLGIMNDIESLRWFWSKCKSEQRRTKTIIVNGEQKIIKGSFNKTFFGMLK